MIQRDIDVLRELAKHNLVRVNLSITSLDDKLRRVLEPRTSSAKKKLQTIEVFSKNDIPVTVLMAPIIPSLNDYEIPSLLKQTSEAGAQRAGFTIIRLNDMLGELFTVWVHKVFPDRANKIISQIEDLHGCKLNDSRYGTRMKGEGKWAQQIKQNFQIFHRKYFGDKKDDFVFNFDIYHQNKKKQLNLFD